MREVLDAADGSFDIRRADGTSYDVWADGRSGHYVSPKAGSLLRSFTDILRALGELPRVPPRRRGAAEADLRRHAGQLLDRIAKQEPCLERLFGDMSDRLRE